MLWIMIENYPKKMQFVNWKIYFIKLKKTNNFFMWKWDILNEKKQRLELIEICLN